MSDKREDCSFHPALSLLEQGLGDMERIYGLSVILAILIAAGDCEVHLFYEPLPPSWGLLWLLVDSTWEGPWSPRS